MENNQSKENIDQHIFEDILINQQRNLYEIEFKCKLQEQKEKAYQYGNNDGVYYKINVKRQNKIWEIIRQYQDFQWLFQALKNRFPGTILPYFPSTSIYHYLQHKTKSINLKLKMHFLAPRQQQLVTFLSRICQNKQYGKSQQINIFMLQGQEFYHKKIQKPRQIQTAKQASKTFNIFSFISRGISWFINKNQQKIQGQTDLIKIRCYVNNYSSEIMYLIQKFGYFLELKYQQMQWDGSCTQIDSVQMLKAKFITSLQFNNKLISDIEDKILFRLLQELKRQGQIQQQINDRIQAAKLIQYLSSINEADSRIELFKRHNKLFDKMILTQWPIHEQQWKKTVNELDNKFREIWIDFSNVMNKIWK